MLNAALVEDLMAHVRRLCALLLCLGLAASPVWSETITLGTVTSALNAYVGTARASAGSTVFEGDRLSTEPAGIIQIRTKAARLQLVQSGTAELTDTNGVPTATLLRGTAVFSTANARAFVLRASIAEIRADSDAPTVGQVWMISPKELRVQSTRGTLAVTVDGETKLIPEATAYRVLLDPDAPPPEPEPAQEPQGAGAKKERAAPVFSAQNRVIYTVTAVVAVGTILAVRKALESPDRP